jgi:hypothetical protein
MIKARGVEPIAQKKKIAHPQPQHKQKYKAVLAAAEKNDVRWGLVEQDKTYDTPPLEALRTSMENLKKLGADPKTDPLAPR